MLNDTDVSSWVRCAPLEQATFRQAAHVVLAAVGASSLLRMRMIMKGGLLMAIRYDSSRFTRDVDFSTAARYEVGDQLALLAELDRQLTLANDRSAYGITVRRQRSEIRPRHAAATSPSLSLTIGYARNENVREMQRLAAGRASTVVEIDYSYNEAVLDVEVLRLSDGCEIQAYGQVGLMAEKFRALLQQPTRRRNRRQDVYDLALLLQSHPIENYADQSRLLECLLRSAQLRGISVHRDSMRDEDVRKMAAVDYEQLGGEISGRLPLFDEAYTTVRQFYEQLPW
jgi:predicted nucleotidyltransferase component of viral defense system